MDQYIGKMLDGRYEILESIGTGGMAVVYKARDHRLNRLVAVKILKPELASDGDIRRRFHDESQAVAMLSHINIVSVYDVSESDGLDYIVMELIDGLTLKQFMKKRGAPLNWREALHFITQILRALSHAHSRGIIHRDIKPQNILVLRDGSVKVTDFGIAQIASANQHTMTSEALGSVHYISPEQAKGSHVDCRTDIYSAGVVLYEMLTGRLPFEGDTPVFVAIQHINSIPIQPRELNPDIPPALEAIVLKAMAPELSQRYASAEEMLADLKEFRKNPDANVVVPAASEAPDEPTMVVPAAKITAAEPAERKSREPARARQEVRRERRRQEEAEWDSPRERRRRVEIEDDYDDDEGPPRHVGGTLAAAAAVVVILAFLGAMVYFVWLFLSQIIFNNEVPEYRVPNILGYTQDQLRENPTILNGFTVEVEAIRANESYPEGQICAQDPLADTVVREGGKTIRVVISGGSDKIYMIDVLNWEYREAVSALRGMNLTVDVQEEFSDTVLEGHVISYSPMAEVQLQPGQMVTIVVSKGPDTHPVIVVPYTGVPYETALNMILQSGLTIGSVDSFPSDVYGVGIVSWQSIPANTSVPQGTAIDLWISLGPEGSPSASPSAEPSPDTSGPPESQPPSSAPPEESGAPEPSANTGMSTRTVTVDLSKYAEEGYAAVDVRIVVGTLEANDRVNPAAGSVSHEFTASGTQQVNIYINGELTDSYELSF